MAAAVERGIEEMLLVAVVGDAVEVGNTAEVDVVGKSVIVVFKRQTIFSDSLVERFEIGGRLEQIRTLGCAVAFKLLRSDVEEIDAREGATQRGR